MIGMSGKGKGGNKKSDARDLDNGDLRVVNGDLRVSPEEGIALFQLARNATDDIASSKEKFSSWVGNI